MNGKLLFTGEYLNNKMWNGKVYDDNDDNCYELKNGNGYIKEYNENGILKYEGEYLNGKRNGKGKEYYCEDKLIYVGEYLNGKRNGKGKEYYFDGILRFDGEYLNNKRWNGKGYNDNHKVTYELKNGNGIMKEYNRKDILVKEGEYLNGELNGKVKIYYNGKLYKEIEYLNGKKMENINIII